MQWGFRVAEMLAQFGEGRVVRVIAVNIVQQAGQLGESSLIHATVFLEAVFRALLQLFHGPAGLSDTDDGKVESLILNQVLKRWKNLFVRQIARGSKKYECVRHSL